LIEFTLDKQTAKLPYLRRSNQRCANHL